LSAKKNLILQGAPGVGKTFVAKRLAYALMESADDSRIKMVQFHPHTATRILSAATDQQMKRRNSSLWMEHFGNCVRRQQKILTGNMS